MTAHYFKSKTGNFVIISETNRPIGTEIKVEGKKQAREIAKMHDAVPWNF